MNELTQAQKKAVEAVQNNVCVSAGAGTGKTRVLVERFLYLIENGLAHPQEILAITFTDKAAQEMKARIARLLRERGFEEARRGLEHASIGTIHSFCARILREHPIEAGVDPDFRVLEDDETNLLKEGVLDELIESRFQEAAVFDLLRIYSEDGVRKAVQGVVNRAHAYGMSSPASMYAFSVPSSLRGGVQSQAEANKGPVIPAPFGQAPVGRSFGRAEAGIQSPGSPLKDCGDDTSCQIASASLGTPPRNDGQALNTYASIVAGDDVMNKVLEALKPLKTLKGKEEDCAQVERVLTKKISNWDELESLKATGKRFQKRGKAKGEIEIFRSRLDDWTACQAELLGAPVRSAFLSLASDFENRYRALKRQESTLDFDDLEREAARLLSGSEPPNEACRNLYRNLFKFIMVDEFQDTSPVQDQLISLISRPNNLFIVGDWKQSIYGFRGAEASLFFEKERLFSERGLGENMSLVENFRSKAEILGFINPFFEKLWAGEGRLFEPLQVPQLVIASEAQQSDTSIEFLTIERREGERVAEVRMKEARILAERIQEMAASGTYQYQDFAMLFRVGTDIYFYEHELRNLGIPYYVISGRGFYRQPEIRDLISCLEFIENPHLDIPLTALLRSPLVQVSDDTLVWLAQSSKRLDPKIPLYKAFLKADDIPEITLEDRARLQSFRALFFEFLGRKGRGTISECIEKILDRTQYDRYVLGLPEGKRRFQNIRKLLELARELESRDSIHLGDFIRYVKGLETQEVRESEAQVEALEGNVVKLMTIHKAKGLEFKVVIIPDLNRRGEKRRNYFLIDPEFGLGFRAYNEALRDFEDTLGYKKIREKIIQNAYAESKRLLYVAMTRSRERLILSGASHGNDGAEAGGFDDGANWYEWISQWMGSRPGDGLEHRLVQAPRPEAPKRPSRLAERENIRAHLRSGEALPMKVPASRESIIQALKPITPVYFERIDLPVTAYAVFGRDPEEYRRVYEMGAFREEGLKCEEWPEDDDEQATSAADFGTVIHKIFEHLVGLPEEAQKRLPFWLERFQSSLDEKSKSDVKTLSEKFLSSKQFSEIRGAKARHPEIPFVLRLRSGIIQGTIDLLYQRPDGSWVILDYKTSHIEPSLRESAQDEAEAIKRPPRNDDELAVYAERYRPQMMLYALACSELLKIPVTCAALYFVRLDRSFVFSLEAVDFENLKGRFEAIQKEIITKRKNWIV